MEIKIKKCTDPMRWYSKLVGETVPFVKDTCTEWQSREPEGFTNFVQYGDGEIVNAIWECKYCGMNDEPGCHKCVREDGKCVSDELVIN